MEQLPSKASEIIIRPVHQVSVTADLRRGVQGGGDGADWYKGNCCCRITFFAWYFVCLLLSHRDCNWDLYMMDCRHMGRMIMNHPRINDCSGKALTLTFFISDRNGPPMGQQ